MRDITKNRLARILTSTFLILLLTCGIAYTVSAASSIDTIGSFESLASGDLAVGNSILYGIRNMSIPGAVPAIYKYSTSDYRFLGTISPPALQNHENSFGLTWDGTALWCGYSKWDTTTTKIMRIDPQDGSVLHEISVNLYLRGLAWDGSKLWAIGRPDQGWDWYLFKINPGTGGVEATVDIPDRNFTGLAFRNGKIWACEDGQSQDYIWVIDPLTGASLASFLTPANWTHGLAIDSDYLWVSDGAKPHRIFQCVEGSSNGNVVTFTDPNLEQVIREVIWKSTGTIYDTDLLGLTYLSAENRSIADLEGIQYCTNLTVLYLWGNQIDDLAPLAGLTNLTDLDLGNNQISDLVPLSGLTNLTGLQLGKNQIGDLAPLASLMSLTDLWLWRNQIDDLAALAGLTNLTSLHLGDNQINDIQALVDNAGLGAGDVVDICYNYMVFLNGSKNTKDLQTLENRGCILVYEPQEPQPDAAWRSNIRLGDILYDPWTIATIGHAGIYIGNGLVMDPWKTGAYSHPIVTWDYPHRAEVAILRVAASEAIKQAAVQFAKYQSTLYKPYGNWLGKNPSPNAPDWYCSEIVWASYWNEGAGLNLEYNKKNTNDFHTWTAVSPHELCVDKDTSIVGGHCMGFSHKPSNCEEDATCHIYDILGIEIVVTCPVDLFVRSPDGLIISKDINEIEDSVYMVDDIDKDGSVDVVIGLSEAKTGLYQIEVQPKPGADPTDTYTLTVSDSMGLEELILAHEASVGDIPDRPYEIKVTAEGIEPVGGVVSPAQCINHGPNPVLAEGCIFWLNLPTDATSATLKIFDIDGALLVSIPLDPTADRYPAAGRWIPEDDQDRLLGTGLYLYLMEIEHTDGTVTYSPVQKMVIQR